MNKRNYLPRNKPVITAPTYDPYLSFAERRLLMAGASDHRGGLLAGMSRQGFYVQANDESFAADSPSSVAAWKSALKKLTERGYLTHADGDIYELTEEGFIRAEKEKGLIPLILTLAFEGAPNNQMLSAVSTKPITIKRLDFLTSSEAAVCSSEINEQLESKVLIPLDHKETRRASEFTATG